MPEVQGKNDSKTMHETGSVHAIVKVRLTLAEGSDQLSSNFHLLCINRAVRLG
jgi:hypothetical protein